jgi:hypothetical protein
MAVTLFKDTTYSLSTLIEEIRRGEIALPDIQRPFVWSTAKVRDLFDSMYKGFPVGYLLFWATGAESGARQIGVDGKQAAPRLLIVDGQQRLTSLYAVLTAHKILREDYTESRISLAFRPSDARFEVSDAAIERSSDFLPSISVLWDAEGSRRQAVRSFLKRLGAHRGALSDEEADRLEDAIDRLYDLRNYPFKVVELGPEVDEEQVAEVFVRINSEGVTLNQADFILTLMSVFWEKGRRQLEEFSRACKQPSASGASPFNHFIQPQPDQLLRVGVALAFRRAVLKHVYSVLRGKDLDTGVITPKRRERQFETLREAQEYSLDLLNWHEYLKCLARAGFRSSRMISSQTAVVYSYALWLIGRRDYEVSRARLRDVMARWFFMAHTTSRYSGSPESTFENDLTRLRGVEHGDSDGFCAALDKTVSDTFTSDFWTITLPNELDSSAAKSPSLLAHLAALNVLDADVLFSRMKVRELLEPAVALKKGLDRHHLFPRAYLKRIGVSDTKQVNQIANMALLEWWENIDISDAAPADYWPEYERRMDADRLAAQMHWHALPPGWHEMLYPQFLDQRRRLMAAVVREAFQRLA